MTAKFNVCFRHGSVNWWNAFEPHKKAGFNPRFVALGLLGYPTFR
jgi:hypothetical protein